MLSLYIMLFDVKCDKSNPEKSYHYCQIYLDTRLYFLSYFLLIFHKFNRIAISLIEIYKYKFLRRWDDSCALFPLLDVDINWESSRRGFLPGLLFTCIPSELSYLSKRSMSHMRDNAMRCTQTESEVRFFAKLFEIRPAS